MNRTSSRWSQQFCFSSPCRAVVFGPLFLNLGSSNSFLTVLTVTMRTRDGFRTVQRRETHVLRLPSNANIKASPSQTATDSTSTPSSRAAGSLTVILEFLLHKDLAPRRFFSILLLISLGLSDASDEGFA